MIREQITDIIKHTDFAGVQIVLFDDSNSEYEIFTSVEDKDPVVIQGKTKNPIIGLKGKHGMMNLAAIREMFLVDDAAVASITTDANLSASLELVSPTGRFDYQFRPHALVNLTVRKYAGPAALFTLKKDEITFTLFQRLSTAFSQLYDRFTLEVQNGILVVSMGDPNMLATFGLSEKLITAQVPKMQFKLDKFLSILRICQKEDFVLKVHGGCLVVQTETAYGEYSYYLPGYLL